MNIRPLLSIVIPATLAGGLAAAPLAAHADHRDAVVIQSWAPAYVQPYYAPPVLATHSHWRHHRHYYSHDYCPPPYYQSYYHHHYNGGYPRYYSYPSSSFSIRFSGDLD